MPVRRRYSKTRDLGLHDFFILKYGTEEALVNTFGSLEAARMAYETYRHDSRMVSMNAGSRPNAYWLFEGPEELRRHPSSTEDGMGGVETIEDVLRLEDEFECRRLRWLRDNGLLRESEAGALTEAGCD